MVTSGCAVVGAVISEIQLPASMQPKASPKHNAEPGNAGLSLLRYLFYRRGEGPCEWFAGGAWQTVVTKRETTLRVQPGRGLFG